MNFVKVAAASPKVNVADVEYNYNQIIQLIDKAVEEDVKFIVFPELSLTAYTCADLFLNFSLIKASEVYLDKLCKYSKNKDIVIVVGAPILVKDNLFNCGISIFDGKILGIVPKSYLPNYSEFYEKRWFAEGVDIRDSYMDLSFQKNIPFGVDLIFKDNDINFFIEICEDLWFVIPPSSYAAIAGANIIANLSASNEIVGKDSYRKDLIKNQSARTLSSYIYSSAGVHESTTDLLFSGDLVIVENGRILSAGERFSRENQLITSCIDVEKLTFERMKNSSFTNTLKNAHNFREIEIGFKSLNFKTFDRFVYKHPFLPSDPKQIEKRCEEIFTIQSSALAKRFEHTKSKKAVIGISGGLDSTLALLVVIRTFDMLGMDRKNIVTITMPGFGTTDRTYNNAVDLCKLLHCDFREINIVEASLQHFKDIGHDKDIHDVTYENVQARERTQILMDIANKEGGLLIGTGDLSELALGWCTYNGDHMSMYGVNGSIPKTLVKYLVRYVATHKMDEKAKAVLLDILDTPISPELLPKGKDGDIVQKTEDVVGPYELHDFFLYHFMRSGAEKDKISFLAKEAFKDDYDKETIDKWLDKFITRFFTQQFKRSALPDGPKVGTVSLSPRGDLRMPSDASYNSFK